MITPTSNLEICTSPGLSGNWYSVFKIIVRDANSKTYLIDKEFFSFENYFQDKLEFVESRYTDQDGEQTLYEPTYKGKVLSIPHDEIFSNDEPEIGFTDGYVSKLLFSFCKHAKSLDNVSLELQLYNELTKIYKNYRKGRSEFIATLESFIKPFPYTNENLVISIKKILQTADSNNANINDTTVFSFSDKAISELHHYGHIAFTNENLLQRSYKAGLLFEAYKYIASHIDFFKPSDFDFVKPLTEPGVEHINIREMWNGDKNQFDTLCLLLQEKRIIERVASGKLVWQRSGAEFAAFLLALDKTKKFFYLQAGTEKEIFKACQNTFEIKFNYDSLKKSRITTSDKIKTDTFVRIINQI
jgi:hypothetical protein